MDFFSTTVVAMMVATALFLLLGASFGVGKWVAAFFTLGWASYLVAYAAGLWVGVVVFVLAGAIISLIIANHLSESALVSLLSVYMAVVLVGAIVGLSFVGFYIAYTFIAEIAGLPPLSGWQFLAAYVAILTIMALSKRLPAPGGYIVGLAMGGLLFWGGVYLATYYGDFPAMLPHEVGGFYLTLLVLISAVNFSIATVVRMLATDSKEETNG
jgi:hypothetical protein